ncbi:LysR family transcriptional regulator [Cohnella fermenti]|uniref:LysR family transcriptional regulator n=1 Tax=Cohnella fermenti TaxID=2565925 RepID=A0A4S4C6W4_9BACL|nr:LysR family transcriptional regulator [Cohnella fermenti]THF83668.1 LysR family transcriptional regulator [Cohnella fermenti]
MNIENMEAFVYVIHYGSFNKAADALFLSQPSVTARIQSLERELNCQLFDRVGKQVQITEEGKRFLPYAQQLLQIYRKGKQHVQYKKQLPNEMRIGCTVSVANYLIPGLLPALRERFPEIRFKLQTGTTDELAAKVLNKEIDLALARPVNHPELRAARLLLDPIRLHVYEGHPFLLEDNLGIEALAGEPLVFFECGALDWLRIHRIFESLDRPPRIEIQTDNSETAKKLVLQQAGICFLPGICARQEVEEGRLFPIDFAETSGISMQTCALTLQGENTDFVQELTAMIKARTSA